MAKQLTKPDGNEEASLALDAIRDREGMARPCVTERLDERSIERASDILKAGGLVAFPTETVFGLGANALDSTAVERIFVAKGRPADNPLIVHVLDREQMETLCRHISATADRLLTAFTPGPLTLVLPKRESVPNIVTAGLDTVAIRIPAHPVARSLLKSCQLPLAAPSANRSGRPSGTTWTAVLEDFDGRIDAIICSESAPIGIESSVVDLSTPTPRLLRPGAVTFEQLQEVVPNIVVNQLHADQMTRSPGLRHRHYQPMAEVRICDSPTDIVRFESKRSTSIRLAYIGLEPWMDAISDSVCQDCVSMDDYASKLFDFFRRADRMGANCIWCQRVPETGIGRALMDRLTRAAKE